MPTDRTLISLADLVRRAAAIVDPNEADEAVAEFVERYQDDDEPVRGILPRLEEHIRWGADEHPPVVLAQAIVLYLAHRLDEYEDEPADILRLSIRAEFKDDLPPAVQWWLREQGIEVG
jgi:hypothetical protein